MPTDTARELSESRRKRRELDATIEILLGPRQVSPCGSAPAQPDVCTFIDKHQTVRSSQRWPGNDNVAVVLCPVAAN